METTFLFILAAVVTGFVFWAGWSLGYKWKQDKTFNDGRLAGRKEIITEQQAFLEGKEAGRTDAFSEFSITVQPFHYESRGWFNSEYRGGYRMQLFIKGLPVGDATERILREEKQVNEERITQLSNLVEDSVRAIVGTYADRNLKVKRLPTERTNY